MARLIDADKRIAEIKKIYCEGCDNYGGVKCRACWVDDAMCLIDEATTVDAVELTCNVGDTVYQVDANKIYQITIKNLIYDAGHIAFDENAIGKSVFLTRKEAEAKLGGGNDG